MGSFICDGIGPFRLLDCSFSELLLRLQLAWTSIMASHVQHRRTFLGFDTVDVAATRHAYSRLDAYDQGILRKHLHGATLTNEHAQHWSSTRSDLCLKCGMLDSVRHRLLACPATQHIRDGLSVDFLAALPSLPAVVIEHGWTLRPCLANAWLQYLDSIPSEVTFLPCANRPSILDLFTDGSCLFPTNRYLRVASWAVVLGRPYHLDFGPGDFVPLAAQPLHGLIQTVYRAELFAILVALQYAVVSGCGVRIWSDCQSAIAAFNAHVIDRLPVPANSKHCDLLRAIQSTAERVPGGCVAALKVPAHTNLEDASSDLERWLFTGNDKADHLAKSANAARPESVWSLWSAFSCQLELCHEQADAARTLLLEVSKFWTSTTVTTRQTVPQAARPVRAVRAQPELVFEMPEQLVLQGNTFRRSFGLDLFVRVCRWISNIRASDAPLRWISFHQLFISFQRREGPVNVSKVGGCWKVETGAVAALANHQRLGIRVKFFRLMLQQCFKDCSVRFATATVRPASQWICCFKGSLAFGITQGEYDFIEGFLASQLTEPATGPGLSLDRLHL